MLNGKTVLFTSSRKYLFGKKRKRSLWKEEEKAEMVYSCLNHMSLEWHIIFQLTFHWQELVTEYIGYLLLNNKLP